MEIAHIDRLYNEARRAQGWLLPHACRLMAILDSCHKLKGVTGNLFEIGVYHGKSAIMLASLLSERESLGVCDIAFATRGAGGESRTFRQFRKNMNRFFGDAAFLRVYSKDSRELSRDDISPDCRLIHIDGAHKSARVYEDLVIAESCLHAEGAIVLDDAYAPRWPGVMDGIYRFLYEHPNRLVPLVSGFAKLVLVRPGTSDDYAAELTDSAALKERFGGKGPHNYKRDKVMGDTMHTYFPTPPARAEELVRAAAERLPWLYNPVTRRLNRSWQKLRDR